MNSVSGRTSPHALTPQSPNGALPRSSKHAKIESAAMQFESVLLEEMCSKLRKSLAQDEEHGVSGDEGFSDLGTKYLALGLSQRGGIGITKVLIPYLRSADKSDVARLEQSKH